MNFIFHADHSISFTIIISYTAMLFVIHRLTSITPPLKSISPLFGWKNRPIFIWNGLFINCYMWNWATHKLIDISLIPLCVKLTVLLLFTFSSGDYNRLITAIATSKLTYFTADQTDVDVTRAKVLATLLVDSKTLEEVEVIEPIERPRMNKDVAVILAEAMNHSSVKKLTIRRFRKGTELDCHYPTDRVNIIMSLE